ncbi:MAG TPA: 2-C-methyl-D-erythritol 2,4-cyclodiphosphate synthase [Thermodesulfobacteriota bacterium]
MIRVGLGYDIHRLVEGRRLVLGGVEIPFERGLDGNSDADVLTHACCDALLGAVAAGDLGRHFPERDPQWKGVSSLVLLERVVAIVAERGYAVSNVDATIIAERPRLASHVREMAGRLAAVLRVAPDAVSVKATTTNGLGLIARGDAVAACAVAAVSRTAA